MSAVGVLYVIYAVVLLLGGAMGYAKAKSVPSLVAGVVSAAIMLVAVWLLRHGDARAGLALGNVVSVALAGFFFQRYRDTRKVMPAVLICVLSAAVIVFSSNKLFGR